MKKSNNVTIKWYKNPSKKILKFGFLLVVKVEAQVNTAHLLA